MRNGYNVKPMTNSVLGSVRSGAVAVATTCAALTILAGCGASSSSSPSSGSEDPVGDVEQRSMGDADPYAKYFVAKFKSTSGSTCLSAAKARPDAKYCECWKTGDAVFSLYCGKGLPHSGGTGSAAGPNILDPADPFDRSW